MKIKKYLESSPVFALNSAYEAIIPKLNKQLKLQNINLIQGLVLTALFFEDKTDVNPSQLAKIFQTTKSNISHMISDLEYKGYLRRVVNEKDARGFKIQLKSEGHKKALSLVKFYDQIQTVFEKKMGIHRCQKTVESFSLMTKIFNMNQFPK
jgi:DNA-binding MarR family transcriptional regulator